MELSAVGEYEDRCSEGYVHMSKALVRTPSLELSLLQWEWLDVAWYGVSTATLFPVILALVGFVP